jgi:hypothetical protein
MKGAVVKMWDPSMATTACANCGCCIEAWLILCEACEEEEEENDS